MTRNSFEARVFLWNQASNRVTRVWEVVWFYALVELEEPKKAPTTGAYGGLGVRA